MKKKTVMSFVVGVVAFGLIAGSAAANSGAPAVDDTINVNAEVQKWVSVTSVPGYTLMQFGQFEGYANEELGPRDSAKFEVETNADVNLEFEGGDLSTAGNTSGIKTAYVVNHATLGWSGPLEIGWFNRDRDYNPVFPPDVTQAEKTKMQYEIIGFAKLGEISDQEANTSYDAVITLTVHDANP